MKDVSQANSSRFLIHVCDKEITDNEDVKREFLRFTADNALNKLKITNELEKLKVTNELEILKVQETSELEKLKV